MKCLTFELVFRDLNYEGKIEWGQESRVEKITYTQLYFFFFCYLEVVTLAGLLNKHNIIVVGLL